MNPTLPARFSNVLTQISKRFGRQVGPLPFTHYRGIGRYPFTEYPVPDPGWQGSGNPNDDDQEPAARALLEGFLSADDYETPYPRAFVSNLEQAHQIRAALKAPGKFEIVELCMQPERPAELLGFDIGYWGGGNFSILCDAAIWPIWHPPEPKAFEALSAFTRKLNRHALFPSWESAQDYLNWYRQQAWSETEPSEFSIIAVGVVKDAGEF